MTAPMRIVILGLSLSSSWGNGHATTYRALIKALAAEGHSVLFLERDVPWYAAHRDMPQPDSCELALYADLADLERWEAEVRSADAVIIGSYVPEGIAVGDWVRRVARGPVAFYDIDTPVTLAQLAGEGSAYLAARQIPAYDVYFSFTGGPTLERLEREFGSPAARALYCAADAELYRPQHVPVRWDLSYLGTYSDDRQPVLERLLIDVARQAPGLRFAVAGAQYPEGIDWPANVERLEHVPPPAHPAFYSASRFTLNVTRADMVAAGHSPSIRLFEAAACGTPILSDRWNGIETLFTPGREILLSDSAADVLAALAMDPADRQALADAARRRVLAMHTAEHRAATLAHELRAAIARRRRLVIAPSRPRDAPRRVLVAGGAGFLGSHLCDRLLDAGDEVLCLDNLQTGKLDNLGQALGRPGFTFVEADVVDQLPIRVLRSRFDRIYNLACPASPPAYQADPQHTLLTSVLGTKRLLDLAEATGARLLLASTSEVYGDPDVHPQPETYLGNVDCTGPRACYDEGKRCAETLCFDHDRAERATVRVARIFNTYGPRLSPGDGRVVSNLIGQALAGDDLTVFGSGGQTRSFCYVDDLITGLVALMEHRGPQPGPVNLGTCAEMTILELVERIRALTGTNSRMIHQPLPRDDPRRRRPDIATAERLLGWQPSVPLDAGLQATIDWFRAERARAAGPRAEPQPLRA